MIVHRRQAALAGPARMDFRVGDLVDSVGSVHVVVPVLVLVLAPTIRLTADRVSATLRETSPRR